MFEAPKSKNQREEEWKSLNPCLRTNSSHGVLKNGNEIQLGAKKSQNHSSWLCHSTATVTLRKEHLPELQISLSENEKGEPEDSIWHLSSHFSDANRPCIVEWFLCAEGWTTWIYIGTCTIILKRISGVSLACLTAPCLI